MTEADVLRLAAELLSTGTANSMVPEQRNLWLLQRDQVVRELQEMVRR